MRRRQRLSTFWLLLVAQIRKRVSFRGKLRWSFCSQNKDQETKTAMSLERHTKSLLDPFDEAISQPKLLDGKVPRSSGIGLCATGDITCNNAGSTHLALIPGASNAICWRADNDPTVSKKKQKTEHLFCFTLDEALQPSRLFRRSHTDRSE